VPPAWRAACVAAAGLAAACARPSLAGAAGGSAVRGDASADRKFQSPFGVIPPVAPALASPAAGPRTLACHPACRPEREPPLAAARSASGRARPARTGLRLVHRGLRHGRPPGGRDTVGGRSGRVVFQKWRWHFSTTVQLWVQQGTTAASPCPPGNSRLRPRKRHCAHGREPAAATVRRPLRIYDAESY